MATPVALNHPWMHLDGLIAHLVHQRVLGRGFYGLPTKTPSPLPSAEHPEWAGVLKETRDPRGATQHLRHAIPCASISFFEDDRMGTLQYFKRFEAEGFPAERKIYIGHGHYRAWMMRWVYIACSTVTFYGVGDLDRLRDILQDLTHLGNDIRVGWGRIHRLHLRELEEDRSLVWQGLAQRPIPTRFLRRWSDAVPLAWRPSYWSPANVEDCAPPGAEVEWR